MLLLSEARKLLLWKKAFRALVHARGSPQCAGDLAVMSVLSHGQLFLFSSVTGGSHLGENNDLIH